MSTRPEFSVYQFFSTGEYERVREYVVLTDAMQAVEHYCKSVAARMGIVNRVIMTDGGDHIVFEWRFTEGVVWPRPKPEASVPPEPPADRRSATPLPPSPWEDL